MIRSGDQSFNCTLVGVILEFNALNFLIKGDFLRGLFFLLAPCEAFWTTMSLIKSNALFLVEQFVGRSVAMLQLHLLYHLVLPFALPLYVRRVDVFRRNFLVLLLLRWQRFTNILFLIYKVVKLCVCLVFNSTLHLLTIILLFLLDPLILILILYIHILSINVFWHTVHLIALLILVLHLISICAECVVIKFAASCLIDNLTLYVLNLLLNLRNVFLII